MNVKQSNVENMWPVSNTGRQRSYLPRHPSILSLKIAPLLSTLAHTDKIHLLTPLLSQYLLQPHLIFTVVQNSHQLLLHINVFTHPLPLLVKKNEIQLFKSISKKSQHETKRRHLSSETTTKLFFVIYQSTTLATQKFKPK